MPRKKHLIDKKVYKLAAGKCRICGETDYALLDNHRILEGSNGGRYTRDNTVVLCCACHRKVHDGQVVIDKYYPSTAGGNPLLRITRDGKEEFL